MNAVVEAVARKKTHRKTTDDDDFDGPTDCWVSHGGETLWAIGYTSNGVPYGLSEDEMRDVEARLDLDQVRRERGQGFAQSWSDAKEALRRAFRALSSPRHRLGCKPRTAQWRSNLDSTAICWVKTSSWHLVTRQPSSIGNTARLGILHTIWPS
jgi:hypothetical protein